jgi:hypothetical protein
MGSGDTLLIFTPMGYQPSATNFGALGFTNQHPWIAFDDTTNETAFWTAIMPQHYAGGGIKVIPTWTCGTKAVLTVTGDTGAYLTNWSFVGMTTSNSDAFAEYWRVTIGSNTATMTIYKDSSRTQSVASGAGQRGTTVTLSQQNSSGLTGSVTIGASAVNEQGTITYNRVKWNSAFERMNSNLVISSDSFSGDQSVYAIPSNDTSEPTQCTVTFTNSQIAGIIDGDTFRVRLVRDAAGVTVNKLVGDAQLLAVELREV